MSLHNNSFLTGNHDRHSDGIVRRCSRCGLELTDAASRECGVGPICRGKDNAIFARQLPANVALSSALFLSLNESEIPAGCERFNDVRDNFIDKICFLQVNNDDLSNVVVSGVDFRNIVDWLDYSLSFRVSRSYRDKVIKIIRSLGYQALAGVLSGDVCMSPARLYIENGMIKLAGKACKAGWLAMKRSVPGVTTPRYRGDRTPYQVSLAHSDKFIDIAMEFWPFVDDDISVDELKARARDAFQDAQANAQILGISEDAQVVNPARPFADFRSKNNGWFLVRTPWLSFNREGMNQLVADFRAIPVAERSYDPSARSWAFRDSQRAHVESLVSRFYSCREV